ncbi:MAG: hypothetical protein FJ100_10405 [Deltaproteobacteria bacterium]|nr:hypothetical protein [Deltaproteobacteria bacterium]
MRVGRGWWAAIGAALALAACGEDELQGSLAGDAQAVEVGADAGPLDTAVGGDAIAADSDPTDAAGEAVTPDDGGSGGTDAAEAASTDTEDVTGPDASADAEIAGAGDGDAAPAEDADAGVTDVAAAADSDDVAETAADAGPDGTPDTAPQCTDPMQCPQPDALCSVATCIAGVCSIGAAPDGSACSDGNPCTDGDACAAGVCAAGKDKPCDDANPCTDDACDPGSGICGSTPTTVACDDGNACTTGDGCKGGACAGGASPNCDDGNVCTTDACDPATGCTATDNAAPCKLDDACMGNAVCGKGACAGKPIACDDGNPCTKDACDPKVGCASSAIGGLPCNDGDACTDGDLCANGQCAPGKAKPCSDSNPCTDDGCDKASGCTSKANTAPCDDNNACTTGDACKETKCNSGLPVACDDKNPCTDDACDPAKGCQTSANTLPCTLGTACDQGVCKAGTCKSTGQKSCDDGNPCTADTCDAQAGCVATPAKDGAACSVGDNCQAASVCKAGKCEAGAKTVCDDKNSCTDDICDPKVGCGYLPNNAPCDDGNKCTTGDKCAVIPGQGAKCVPGAPLDAKTACDDKSPCTAETCDTAKGCLNTSLGDGGTCDDGNVCTAGEKCQGGKCAGGSFGSCDDGNACTADNCDPATGNCSWIDIKGPCDDKNGCTSGDQCVGIACQGTATVCDDKDPCTADACNQGTGKCAAAPTTGGPCNDGSACTSGDACASGKCLGKSATCDDGNACTDDTCDPKSGACAFAHNTAPCGGVDACTTGGVCAAGACQPGNDPKCDDGNPCSTDACDTKTALCSHTPAADGTACDDGIACTTASACKTGACLATVECKVYGNAFECGKDSGFKIDVPAPQSGGQPRKVVWAVDATPQVPEQGAKGCTLNFNDGTDHCDPLGSQCQLPKGTATSPVADFSAIPGLLPSLVMDIYYDVDIQGPQYQGWDAPKVTLRNAATGAELASWVLPVTNGDIKKWKNGYKIDMPQAKGLKVTVDFTVNLPYAWLTTDQGNLGAGIFVDNFTLQASVEPEANCGDSLDNDGNGKTDCEDASCAFGTLCTAKVVVSDPMACGTKNWTVASNTATVVWAVDQTPVAVKAKTGDCTLNFNDGVDYVPGTGAISNQATAGSATWAQTLDLAPYKAVFVALWAYQDVEGAGACWAGSACQNVDRMFVQLSGDNFAGCGCAANASCGIGPNQCNTNGTTTWIVNKDKLKTWTRHVFDASKFGGKKATLRVRFDSVDAIGNNHPGVFVDDLLVLGK